MATTLTETATARCARYLEENGFAGAEVDTHQHIILRAGAVDAIQMPRPLGERVRAELVRRELTTPVIGNRSTGFLTFLTQPAPAGDSRPIRILSKLFKFQAIRTVQGSLIMLPGPCDEVRFWLDEPVGESRPVFDTVVDIILDAAKSLPKAV
jgi:hypothetical protein